MKELLQHLISGEYSLHIRHTDPRMLHISVSTKNGAFYESRKIAYDFVDSANEAAVDAAIHEIIASIPKLKAKV